MKKCFLLCLLSLILLPSTLHAQDSTSTMTINPSEGLSKGYYVFSVGLNFGQFTSKNEDALIYYILDEENTIYNIKLGFGYNIDDYRSIGAGFRFFNDDTSIEYENAVGDTINTTSLERRYVTSLYYGISKSLFGSKRVFFVTDPSLFFTVGNTNSNRTFDGISEESKSTLRSISVGLHVGLQVFLAPKLSTQILVGPVGVGYIWEDFELDGESNGSNESFFVRMSPDILNFEFSISRYF